jgi:hypothetical protein
VSTVRSIAAKALCGSLLLALPAAAAHAQVIVYEVDHEPLFEIDFPDGWLVDLDFADEARAAGTFEEGEELGIRIIEANPADGAQIWVGFWVVPGAATLQAGLEYAASLNRDLFTELGVSAPEVEELNGMDARVVRATARREGQEVEMILVLFKPRVGTIAAGLYVGAVDAWKAYRPQLEAMIASLEPAS